MTPHDRLLEKLAESDDAAHREIYRFIFDQNEELCNQLQSIKELLESHNTHVQASEEYREILDELKPVEKVRALNAFVEYANERREKMQRRKERVAEFWGRVSESAATTIGKHVPKLLIVLGVLLSMGWERLVELWPKIWGVLRFF